MQQNHRDICFIYLLIAGLGLKAALLSPTPAPSYSETILGVLLGTVLLNTTYCQFCFYLSNLVNKDNSAISK